MSNNGNELTNNNTEQERQNSQVTGFDVEAFAGKRGTDGDDFLYDPNESDFMGLKGDDTLYGNANDNNYYYRSGDGNDTIIDWGGSDKLVLTDLNLADISFERSGRYGVVIRIAETDEVIELKYQEYSTQYALESIEFADGSSLSASEISAALPAPTFNVAPTVQGVELEAVDEDTTMVVTSEQLLANSTDANGDTLTVRYAYLSYADREKASLVQLEDGNWQVTPKENFNGEDLTIHYVVTDGQYSRSARATFNVNAVNDAAIANDDNFTKFAGDALIIDSASLVENDTDIDGDTLIVTAVSAAQNAVVLLSEDGTIEVQTAPDYRGAASFSYTVMDAGGALSTATVHINVLQPGDFDLEAFEGKKGTEGDDYMRANNNGGDIIGLAGDDRIYGSRGDDNYFYRAGDGNDFIYDTRGNDKLTLVDLNAEDITITRSGRWDTLITINETQEQILLKYQGYYQSLNTIEFANGDSLNIAEALQAQPITGTQGRDYLYGTRDDDTLNALAGNDYLTGDAGSDTLNGGEGHDRLYGGADDDLLNGDAGNDSLFGGQGNDTLVGGEGNDYLYDYQGDNRLEGGAGDDRLIAYYGDNTLDGGAGNDYIYTRYGSNTIKGGEGDDTIVISAGENTLTFEDLFGDDTVYYFEAGEGSNDVISFTGIESLTDFDAVIAASSQEGSDTLISVADSSIRLKHVELESLNEADFIFG